jgi:hypothetical protein
VTWSVRDVLFVLAAFAVFGAVAYATTRHPKCIHCEFRGSADDLYHHHCHGMRAKQTVG